MGSVAQGQVSGGGRLQVGPPTRPTLSPYLNLARENTGVLPSYQAFVLPRLEQNQQKMYQWQLQTQTQRIESTLLSDPNLRPTGMGGKFQNKLHFYPTQSNR